MTRIFFIAAGVTAAICFASIAAASEMHITDMQATSSSVTSEYAALTVGKSLVVDLPEDAAEAFVGNPKTVLLTMRSARRIYLTGGELGQTSVYLFARDGRQIGGLDISVSNSVELHPSPLKDHAVGGEGIDIYRGATEVVSIICSPTKCTTPPKEQPPENKTVYNSTYTSPSGTSSSTATSDTSVISTSSGPGRR
jgi:Flp pilus assembly secretin CpaC